MSTDTSAAPRSASQERLYQNVPVVIKTQLLTDSSVFLQVRCGRRPCLLPKALPPPADSNPPPCPGGHECVEHQFLTCFSPPCHQWGVCSTPDPPTPLHTQCEPNSGYLDNSCARITLIFKKDKVPQVSDVNLSTSCITISV